MQRGGGSAHFLGGLEGGLAGPFGARVAAVDRPNVEHPGCTATVIRQRRPSVKRLWRVTRHGYLSGPCEALDCNWRTRRSSVYGKAGPPAAAA